MNLRARIVWLSVMLFAFVACVASEASPAPEQTAAVSPSAAQPRPAATEVASPPTIRSTATTAPATPTATLDKAAQAKALADKLVGAASDQARYEALLAVMQALAVGVYTPDGQTIVNGAERGTRDFYLYDFELSMMAQSLVRQDTWRLEDMAGALTEMGLRPDDQPLSAEAMWRIMQDTTREAAQQSSDRLSLVPLLVRELGLRKPAPYDTLQVTGTKDLPFDALQRFLIVADFTLPMVQKVWPLATGPSHLVGDMDGVLKLKPVVLQNPCETMVGTVVKEGWGIGKFGLAFIKTKFGNYTLGEYSKLALVIIDGIHGSMMAFSIKVQAFDRVRSTHYGHDTPGDPKEFKIIVAMLDELPDVVIKCGWLLGVEFPKKGGIKDVKILWFYGDLDQHGEIVCPETGCKKTDQDGIATLRFKPKQELAPYGFGPEQDADGSVTAVALYQSRLKNYLGSINQIITPKYAVSYWLVTYHKQPEFDLDFASYLDGTVGAYRGSTVALLESPIHIKFDPAKGYNGKGTLHYETKPLPRQHKCDLIWSGSGSTTLDVVGLHITGDPNRGQALQIELDIVPGPTKETGTDGCPVAGSPASYEGAFWAVLWNVNRIKDFDYGKGGYPVKGWSSVVRQDTGELHAEKEWRTSCEGLCVDVTRLILTSTPPK